ncbi:MAG: hypothetical protein WDN04_23280 [Rhodospirillales bacterium]
MPARVGHLTAHGAAFLTYRHIDRIEADDVELHNLRALVDPRSYPNGKPASTDRMKLLASSDVYGVTLRVEPPPPADGGPVVPPFDMTMLHAHAAGLSARLFASPPSPDSLKSPAFAADLLRAIAEESASVEGISAQIPRAGSFTMGNRCRKGLRRRACAKPDDRGDRLGRQQHAGLGVATEVRGQEHRCHAPARPGCPRW